MWKLLIGVFIFLYGSSFSQNPKVIDSLLTKLKYTTVDSVKAAILNDLSWEYNKGDPRKAMLYADELLKFSEGIRYKWGIAAGYSDIAFCHEYLSNYPEALRYHLMSLRMAEAMGRKRLIARFYNNVASVYERVGEFDLSLRYYFKKLAIVEEKNFKNPEKLLASTYNNIGCVYRDKKQFDSALKYLYISNELTMKIGDSTTLANTYLNLGLVYGESGAYRMALQSFDKAARIAEKVRYDRAFPMIFNGTAAVYNKMKKPDQAVIFAHKGIEASRACGSRVAEFAAYENLVYAYNAKRDYEKKSEMQDRVMALKDSIFNAEKNEQLTNLRVQFETEEAEKENTLLAEQNKVKDLQLSRNRYITWGLIAVVIFTILLAFLLFRQSRLKSQQKAIKLEQKLLRSQMNPHFIFNSLMAIESFIYTSEPREA
jgi:tetratricopeptide (TPR) repeat protein